MSTSDGAEDHRQVERIPVLSRWWHGALAVLLLIAFVTQIVVLLAGGADANSGQGAEVVGVGTRLVRFFSYFTIQSNLIALAAVTTLALNPLRDGKGWRVLRLDALLGIVITGLVFDIVLSKQVHLEGLALALTIVFHYISPWWTLLGWLLFGPRPRISWSTVGLAFVWPVAWIAYTFVHGAASHWYPYPFLDADSLGFPEALRNTLLVVLLAAVLAIVFKLIDGRLPTIRR